MTTYLYLARSLDFVTIGLEEGDELIELTDIDNGFEDLCKLWVMRACRHGGWFRLYSWLTTYAMFYELENDYKERKAYYEW